MKTLYCFSILLTACTLVLILAGGLVTSHEAGLAVPDWPLSYGQMFPPMVGNVFWEHGHRMIAGTIGILTLILAVWLQVSSVGKKIKKFGWALLFLVVLQAVLGGLTVLYMLPAPISIFHACLGQTFFVCLIAMTYFLNPAKKELGLIKSQEEIKSLKRLLIMTTSFIYIQLILGATIRHADWGTIPHIFWAFVILIHILLLVTRVSSCSEAKSILNRISIGLGVLVLIQIFLGLGSFITTQMLERSYEPSLMEVWFTAAHQTTGALILGSCFLMTVMVMSSYDKK